MAEDYPLHWPPGHARTKHPEPSRFKTTLPQAIANVNDELRLFGKDTGKPIKDLVLSSNVTLSSTRPADSGVAAYFMWDGMECCIPVDRYKKVEENLQAIAKVIEAERAKMRHGGLNIVRAAFRGYAALPPPENAVPWWIVLGLGETASLRDAREAHRRLAKDAHPDVGGSAERMAKINRAWEQAQQVLG